MRLFIFSIFLICFSLTAFAQTIEQTANNILSNNQVPGIGILVLEKNKIKVQKTFGLRRIEYTNKLLVSDIFHLGSNSKALTALLSAKLIDKGFLNWKMTLKELFPHIKTNSQFSNLTFDSLLVHRAGMTKDLTAFGDVWDVLRLPHTTPRRGREYVAKKVLTKTPSHPIGTYNYSNASYLIAANALEELTNKSFEELMTLYVFKPLGMHSCGFGPTSIQNEKEPTTNWGHVLYQGKVYSYHGDNPNSFGPAGAVHCSLLDWSKFISELIKGHKGNSTFLNKSNFKKLFKTYPEENSIYTYGGWIKYKHPITGEIAFSHDGSNTINYSRALFIPNSEKIILGTFNMASFQGMQELFKVLENQYLK